MSAAPLWAVLLIGIATGGATLVGGNLVLRFSSTLDLIIAFSSGTLVGVALFDLLPEALDLAGANHSHLRITTAVAAGFLAYLVADRGSSIAWGAGNSHRHFAPASLTLHSLVDGLGIGLAFHVSLSAGIVVAIGVLAHDFLDGANTVALSLSGGSARHVAQLWLAADATAPFAGILFAGVIAIPPFSLALLLGLFAGFFLYIGASDLLPRSLARRPRLSTIGATATGLIFVSGVIWLASQGGV
jgi:ZIP family zinc transporter